MNRLKTAFFATGIAVALLTGVAGQLIGAHDGSRPVAENLAAMARR